MKIKALINFFLFISLLIQARAGYSICADSLTPIKFPMVVASPNSKLKLEIRLSPEGELSYSFAANSKILIENSIMGLSGIGKPSPASVSRRSIRSVWKPVWGKRAVVPEQFNEATLDIKTCTLIVRAYNNGVAFKYEFPKGKAINDLTQFNFKGDYTAWYYNGERPNIGPEKLTDCDNKRLPVMTIKADDNNYLAIHEADLSWGEPLVLQSKKRETLFTIASKPNNAWKVIMYGTKPGELVDSHLLELLNPPPLKDLDYSWVKPGVAVWDWRIAGAHVDGFKYNMSLPSWKRMVDFAAANNIRYLMLDADWYGPEFGKDSDPLKGGKVAQVHEIIRYGKTKNIGIWLYLNDVGGRQFPIDQTLKQYKDWGAAGIKYGFMSGSPAEKNERTRMITELCAKYHLLCDFHDGPVHPYGQMRTYPNAVTREYCQAQLDGATVLEPKTFVTSVFVNMLAGPLDMNNGLADLKQQGRTHSPNYSANTTLVAEAARTLITFSGVTVIPDIPENYQKHPEILQFIAAQKMPWLESKTISGEIGEYIVMARQASDKTWLVAAATNENARELDIPLSFLKKGKYQALVIQDGDDADYRTENESYKTSNINVKQSDIIHVKLAPGGGACIMLKQ
ncbi:glycoside hydrolase family 97 protein [Mucilaginibacter segetis]|uniref:Glycoside hydrolase family 97 catalytic domain-containing protein n=1 Tax=Mucilaginibacter segetis TaxID=2793071 RepID=A0A934PXB8_9SPHI|nr:glycoside hydrolase family 97 protein [Mucilaginibacter segetis]MBK0380816.1 glycoside hydrolase family 97 catalytic domain-containing protein [Mucilaginibacter segetis]